MAFERDKRNNPAERSATDARLGVSRVVQLEEMNWGPAIPKSELGAAFAMRFRATVSRRNKQGLRTTSISPAVGLYVQDGKVGRDHPTYQGKECHSWAGLLKLSFSPLNLLKKNKSLLQKNKKNKSRPSCFARQQKRPIYTECECFHVRLRDDIHYANFLGSIMLRAQPNDSMHKDGIYIVLTSHWYLMTWR